MALIFSISLTSLSDGWSEIQGSEFVISCNSICVSLVGRVVSLVCLCTQLSSFQKWLQYKSFSKVILPLADAEVPMVEKVFTFIEEQKLLGYVLSFGNVLFIIKIDICLISSIL